MAHNDTEIEIKIAVSEENFLKIKEKLWKIAKFVKKDEQSDEYFDLANRSFFDHKHPFEWLSIRKRGGKNILNYKKYYKSSSGEFTHCDEFDIEVSDADKLSRIFSSIDLKRKVVVDKIREVYNYKDEIEIDMDFIKELGYFIEIESIKDFGGVDATRARLYDFAKELGIDISGEVKVGGYAYLMMQKKGLIK